MLREGTAHVVDAMRRRGVERIAAVGTIGSGDSESCAPLLYKALLASVMRRVMADKNAQERIFTERDGAGHGLGCWCIVRPGSLTQGLATGNVEVIEGGLVSGAVTRADLARVLLQTAIAGRHAKHREGGRA